MRYGLSISIGAGGLKARLSFLLILTPVSYITHNFQELLDGSPQKHPGQELVWAMDIILSLIQLYFFIGCFLNQEPIIEVIKSRIKNQFYLFMKTSIFIAAVCSAIVIIPINLCW